MSFALHRTTLQAALRGSIKKSRLAAGLGTRYSSVGNSEAHTPSEGPGPRPRQRLPLLLPIRVFGVLAGVNFGLGMRDLFARLWIGPGPVEGCALFTLLFAAFFRRLFFF